MIVATVRTRDEQENIGQFCASYTRIADKILVADGGSEDRTLEIASRFPKVEIRNFTERTELEHGHWRNNDAKHIQFLVDWAEEYHPDWIIHDDCDSRPNFMLKNQGRIWLEETDKNVVMTCRVYLYGKDQYFPHMMHLKPPTENNYMTSLWAWRPKINLWFKDLPPAYTVMLGDEIAGDLHETESVLDLMPPFCLLHFTWDSEQKVERKLKTYKESGLIPGQLHPLRYAGPLKDLPRWAYE